MIQGKSFRVREAWSPMLILLLNSKMVCISVLYLGDENTRLPD